jgi:hypothetical protein
MNSDLNNHFDAELDTSWIKDISVLHSVVKLMEKEPMQSITIQFIYMNQNKEIEKIEKQNCSLHSIQTNSGEIGIGLSKETLMYIIQNKKMDKNHKKYTIFDILFLYIDIEPEYVQKQNADFSKYIELKSFHVVNDLLIQPSLYILHSIQSIYIFFICSPKSDSTVPIKSILKKESSNSSIKTPKYTKKVKIMDKE